CCFGQHKGFGQCQVQGLISGKVERIVMDTGRRRKCGAAESSVSCRGKIRGAAIRKVRLRDSLERSIAGTAARTTQVVCSEQRSVTALSAIRVSASDVHHGSP